MNNASGKRFAIRTYQQAMISPIISKTKPGGRRRVPTNSSQGFTLVELIIVLAILTITTSFAIPALQSFILKSQVRTLSSDLSRSLWQARNHALSYGKTITICGRDANTSNPVTCDASNSWTNGWVTYMGQAADIPTTSSTLAIVIKSSNSIIASSAAANLSFAPSGLVTQVASAGAEQTFTVRCNNDSAKIWRTLHIQRNGRISLEINKDDVYAC